MKKKVRKIFSKAKVSLKIQKKIPQKQILNAKFLTKFASEVPQAKTVEF